jgi:tetratricopeptide (TPR) repeat protein
MKSILYTTLVIIFYIVTVITDASWAAYPQTITTTSPWVNLPRPTDDPRWAEVFSHWDKRADTDEVIAAIEIIEGIAKDKPDSYECQLWLCRMNYLMAMRKLGKRDDYCRKSIAAGDRALKIKPGDVNAQFWRFASMVLFRELTEEEYREVEVLGSRYRHLTPLPIPDDDPLWAEAIKKYEARMDRDQALAAIEDFKKLDAKYPDRIEPKMYICYTHYWMSEFETTKEGIAKWNKIGAEWGRKAMEIEPRNPCANFLFAVTIGRYAESTGVLAIARHAVETARAIILLCEEDPAWLWGGFSRFLAASLSVAGEISFRVAAMLGFPEDLILRLTVFSTRLEPACLDNYLQLAHMYITLDRMEEAKQALETVINGNPAILKYYEPQNHMVQKEARELYDKHFLHK